MRDIPDFFIPRKSFNEMFFECNRKVAYRSKVVECERCLTWYLVTCGDIPDNQYRNIDETIWCCQNGILIMQKKNQFFELKFYPVTLSCKLKPLQ